MESHSSLGFFGIIRESFKTTTRNAKLLLPILLLVFLLFSQLDFAQIYIISLVALDFVLQLAEHPCMFSDFAYNIGPFAASIGVRNELRNILLVKVSIYAISSMVTLLFVVATVSSSYEAHTAKVLGTKDIFLKIKESWKRPLVTSFYMVLLTLGIVVLYMISIGITFMLAVNSWAVLFFGAITISIPICYFYFAALWMVSVVVSILEEGVGGIIAIGRAAELMKGKKLQASLMMVIFTIAFAVVHLTAIALTSFNLDINSQLAITIPFKNGFFSLLKLFMFVVYTVFYHEWQTSDDEKEGKGVYLLIASGEA